MKRTHHGGGKTAGKHARPPERSRRPHRFGVVSVTIAAFLIAIPVGSASADPKPSLKELAKRVEKMHTEIETLSEQYNGQREKLKTAKKAAEAAKKTLATSEADLAAKRAKAAMLAENAYITGGLGRVLAFTTSKDPDTFLDRAATTYVLEQQQGEAVNAVTKARAAAERARAGAKSRIDEVEQLVDELGGKRDKITKLVTKVESNLFSRALGEAGRPGTRATRVDLPIVGAGKAAQAARWALTQQLKPYVWGAEGPSSYDCSGLVMAAYQKVGISLPHYTGSQWTAGRHVTRSEMRVGDLVFFYGDLHHVGIYLGGGMMVHAPRTGDVVRIASLANRPFAGAVRIAD
ncbi:C40 family peptidase [Nonomuraea fuscirosea]|uniref:Cell wall-associated NlpC family hydrolase n=1 Tax=Nonomuraea fuscirosea TaxID=1291556 RepID=A0A2T0MXR6_9ACTN|nr:C40 family peptidase [Nonomuraea fuscirosea]PRX63898.1 cell wall-associated NlpC family hydrolase [Nonomuraea fuscirosea]WSA51332.1 C40 family peptidase [Nonomuraea fuscirosea]